MSKNPDPKCRCCGGYGYFTINHGPILGDEFVTCECVGEPDPMDDGRDTPTRLEDGSLL